MSGGKPCDGKGNVEVEHQWGGDADINSWANVQGAESTAWANQDSEVITQNSDKPVIVWANNGQNEDNTETTQWVNADGAQWANSEGAQWANSEGNQWNGDWSNADNSWTHTQDNEEIVKTSDADCTKNAEIKEKYGKTQVIKGRPETVIHKPSHVIVNQPPTKVLIHHAPLIVKPSAVVFHRAGKTIHRPVTHKYLPRPVQVRPVYVKLVRPIEKKVLVEKQPGDKPGCSQNVVVEKKHQPGCDKTWVENGDAYQVSNGEGNNAQWAVAGNDGEWAGQQWADQQWAGKQWSGGQQWTSDGSDATVVTSDDSSNIGPGTVSSSWIKDSDWDNSQTVVVSSKKPCDN